MIAQRSTRRKTSSIGTARPEVSVRERSLTRWGSKLRTL